MDAAKVIDHAMNVISDPKSTKMAIAGAMKNMETVRSYLLCSGEALVSATKQLAPMAGFEKYAAQKERENLRDAKAVVAAAGTDKMKQPELLLLEKFVEAHPIREPKKKAEPKKKEVPKKMKASSTDTDVAVTAGVTRMKQPEVILLEQDSASKPTKEEEQSSKRKRASCDMPDNETPTRSIRPKPSTGYGYKYDEARLPPPKSLPFYSKPEVVSVIQDAMQKQKVYPALQRSSQHSIINAVVNAKLVPCAVRSIERLMKRHWEGGSIADTAWASPPEGVKPRAASKLKAEDGPSKKKSPTKRPKIKSSSQGIGPIYDQSRLPSPKNGKFYTKSECVSVVNDTIQKEWECHPGQKLSQSSIIKAIVAAKYIPCGVRSVERLMKRHAEGQAIIDTEWLDSAGGQNRAVPGNIVAQTAARILEQGTRVTDLREVVEKMIVDYVIETHEKAGLVPDPKAVKPSRQTIDKYCVEMAHLLAT